ncbi:MAG: tripartite tricarboxylate transporter substrate binding protein [Pseudomonadota bacterium]
MTSFSSSCRAQRRGFLVRTGALLAAGPFAASFVQAADYPDKPVRILVPTASGGSLDTLGRLLANRLEARLHQTFIVENHPGANGNVAFEAVARAPADGSVLLLASDAITINPHLYQQVRYDPVRSYAPVSLVSTAAQVLVVPPALGVSTLRDFTALAKRRAAEGKPLNIASPGSGSAGHLAAVLYQAQAGVSWTHVPYKGGGPAVADLLGGHVDGLFVTLASAVPQIKAGKLVALAVTTPERAVTLPSVPAVAQAGVPGFDVTNWQGVFAPAGTPAPVVERLGSAIEAIAATPDVKARLVELGFEPVSGGPAALGKLVQENTAKWGRIISQAGIRLD